MDAPSAMERLRTEIDNLDLILCGGLLQGAAYILQGPPGSGKTILANQVCFSHARRGGTALYVTLMAEAHDRMLQSMRPMSFFDPQAVPARLSYISAFAILDRDGLAAVTRLIAEELRARQATLVVLDGLLVASEAARDEYAFRAFISGLQSAASLTNSTVLMLTNEGRPLSAPEYTMVDGWLELTDEIRDVREVRSLAVRKLRGGMFISGRHDFRITDDGIQVFPRIETIYGRTPPDGGEPGRVTTGTAAFDTMLHGGYPRASATLLYGPTGSGKTTLGLQYIGAATPGDPALIFSFFESPRRLMAKAAAIGVDLAGLVERGAAEVVWRDPRERSADELCQDLLRSVGLRKSTRVFVDGLGVLRQMLCYVPERLALVINALNQHLRSIGCTTLYTLEGDDLFLPDDLRGASFFGLMDNMMLLHFTLRGGMLRRNITALKLGESDFDFISEELHITAEELVFSKQGPQRPPPGALRGGHNHP